MPIIKIKLATTPKLERLQYVLDFLKNHPLAPQGIDIQLVNKEADLIYGGEYSSNRLFMPANDYFFRKELKETNQEENEEILSSSTFVEMPFQKGQFSFDIFEAIFFHITRWEEWICEPSDLDLHGRMFSEKMFLVKNDLHTTPIVDQLVVTFYAAIGQNIASRPTRFRMTHDIDILEKFPSIYKFLRAIGNLIFRIKQPQKLGKLMSQYFRKGKDPFDTFDWLLTQNTSFEEKVIYFLSGGTTRFEGFFDIHSAKAKKAIELAKARGYEIGIHPSYEAAVKPTLTEREKEALEKAAKQSTHKTRQHFLRWQFPQTPQLIDQAKLNEDSTLGFHDLVGFRCGTGFPYYLYDFENEKPFTFKEVPLVVMDVSLLKMVSDTQNRFDLNSDAIKKVGEFLDAFLANNQVNTMITFNFHNSTFDEVLLDADGLKDIYIELTNRLSTSVLHP